MRDTQEFGSTDADGAWVVSNDEPSVEGPLFTICDESNVFGYGGSER